MKHIAITFIFFSITITASLIAAGQSNDEESIKNAIKNGWEVSTAKKSDGVKAVWKQDPKVVNTYIGRFNYTRANGWDSIAAITDRNFTANPQPSRTSYTLRNYNIHSNGNMAFAEYEAVVTPVDSDPTSFPYTPDSIRFNTYQVLEKVNNEWKTVALINTNPQSYETNTDHAIEYDINEIGYRFLAAKRYKEAIEVFKTNIKLYPNMWNTYDSLGEAYMMSGDKKMAIENYEKSMKLNPKSESGKAALAKLKQL
jgi:tetratricopeptide (TPR) repeat protein